MNILESKTKFELICKILKTKLKEIIEIRAMYSNIKREVKLKFHVSKRRKKPTHSCGIEFISFVPPNLA